MKARLLIISILLYAVGAVAQTPFEGTITAKVMTSYSAKLIKGAPYLTSYGDTCEILIKGDELHLHYRICNMHRIVKDGRVYTWNDNTKTGFDMPIFSTHTTKGQWIETTGTRSMMGIPVRLYKKTMEGAASDAVEEGWMAEEKKYDFSPVALASLSAVIFSNYLYPMDFGDLFCLKYTGRTHAGAFWEGAMNVGLALSGGGVRTTIAGGDMSQAENAATNEVGASFSFEILSIEPHPIDQEWYVVPNEISFVSQQDSPTVEDYLDLIYNELNPSLKGTMKGPFGKMMKPMMISTITKSLGEQADVFGVQPQDMLSSSYFLGRESILHVQNRKLQKQAEKELKKQQKKNKEDKKEPEKAVIYDINEEWDF